MPTPDITETIPTALSAAVAASQAASSSGARFDVTVGGIGFTLAANDQHPYVRQTAPVQKQQFDSSKEAGEQTLEGDWVRSQTSWHHGAGTRFYEPGSDPSSVNRFDDSLGVDVFTRDTVSLLKRSPIAGSHVFTYSAGTLLRTNLLPNPSAETNTTGYVLGGCTLSRVNTWAATGAGSWSFQITPNAATNDSFMSAGATLAILAGIVAGSTHTVSGTINTPVAQTGALSVNARKIVVYTKAPSTGGSYVTTSSTQAATTGSQRLSVTFTVPADVTECFIRFYNGADNTAANLVQWDGLLLEVVGTLGTYFDGDTTDTTTYLYGWTGTAHGSNSTQHQAVATPSGWATVTAGQVAYATGAVVGGADVLFTNENGTVRRRDNTGAILATYTGAFVTPDTPVAVAGQKILIAHDFGIESGNASGSTFSTLWSQALGATPQVYWAKSRIIATRGVNLYELTLAGGNIDTTTPHYAHPDAGWTWSSVAEAPTAILAAGYSNGRSAIFRFTLEDATSGGTPRLSQAYQASEFPVGEEVLSLHVHLGTYVGIGTTKGIRVGLLSADGQIQYGPLLVECGPVRDIDASDRFLYGAVTAAHADGKSGAVVVDLSEEVEQNTLRFPYAWHARTTTTGRVDSVAVLGASGRVALGAFGEGVYLQSATEYETEGWVRSGRIRFATVELKRFRTVDIGAALPDGQIGLYVVDRDGDETYVLNLTASASDGRAISLAGAANEAVEYLQIRLRLTAASGNLVAPTLDSVLLRAVPVVNRQELIQYPLLCMDREQMAGGRKYGKEGYAFQRFSALKTLEQTMAVVTVSDRTTGETFQAQIEQVEFRRPGPPSADGRPNWGGILSVTVKK